LGADNLASGLKPQKGDAMKVMAAPQKYNSDIGRSLRSIVQSGAHVVGLTEMDLGSTDKIRMIRRVLGTLWAVMAPDRGQHSREIPILVRLRAWIHVLDHKTIQLSHDVGSLGVGNDRWLNIVWLRVWGRIWVVMNLHTNARVQRVDGDFTLIHGPRLSAYEDGMKIFDRELGRVMEDPRVGKRVVVLADFNMLDKGEGQSWEYSPHKILSRHGMHWVSERVIYASWGKGLKKTRKVVTPPNTALNPSDHARLTVTLKRAR
jgi:hypothetical protein